jgi:hypothetical protein
MSKPIIFASALVAAVVAFPRSADAARGAIHPVVMCVPSREQARAESIGFLADGCLFRMSPLFASTSFNVSPQIAPLKSQTGVKRWGWRMEFRF